MFRSLDKKIALIGGAIFVFSVLIRLWGLGWGLPTPDRTFSLHPDESTILAYSTQVSPGSGDFTPGFYNYGTLYLSLLSISNTLVDSYGLGENPELWQVHRAYHLGGRWISVLSAAGTALIVFLFLHKRINLLGSILGSLAMAVAPAFLMHSRFQTVDVLATFLLTVSLLKASQLVDEREEPPNFMRLSIWAGVFAGLSAGTKYTGILALIGVVVSLIVLVKSQRIQVKQMVILGLFSVGAAILSFLIATPGAILESQAFLRDFAFELRHTSEGHGLVFVGTNSGYLYHIATLIEGYGGLLLVMSVCGLAWSVKDKQNWLWGAAAFALVTYLLIGQSEVKFARYTFPMIPALALGFGFLVGRCHEIKSRLSMGVVAAAIFALGGLRGGMVGAARVSAAMATTDPRDEVGALIKKEATESTVLGLARDPWFWSVTAYPEIGAGPMYGDEFRFEAMGKASKPMVVRYIPETRSRIDWDLRLITELQPDLIAFSSFETEGYERMVDMQNPPYPEDAKRFEEFLKLLNQEYTLDILVGGEVSRIHDLMYVRPTVWLWKKKDKSNKTSSDSLNTSDSSE